MIHSRKSRRRVEKITEPPNRPPFFVELREEKWNSRLTDQSKVFYCYFFWVNLRFYAKKKLSKHFDHDFVSEISNTGEPWQAGSCRFRVARVYKFFLMKRKFLRKLYNGCWSLIDSLNAERPAVWLDSFGNWSLSPASAAEMFACSTATSVHFIRKALQLNRFRVT